MLGSYSTSDDEEEQAFYDDEHTASSPYCLDPDCGCHTNVSYHAKVTGLSETTDEDAYAIALSILGQ